MKTIQVLEILTKMASRFKKEANKHINANKHMNIMNGKSELSQEEIDALLVGFINYVAMGCGVDYALCTKDI